MVEAGGVEPPSENASSGTSPGAGGYLHSLAPARAATLWGLVASLFMVRAKLCVRTCTTHRRPVPDRGPSRQDGRIKPRRELRYYRRSLIYKVPVLKMPGASARYSCFRTPVETSTPPCRRGKLRIVQLAAGGKYHPLRCPSSSRLSSRSAGSKGVIFFGASCASFNLPQAASIPRSAAPPLPG